MNERIRKLAIETDAWCDQRYLGDQCYDIKWEQKFAELIVKETMQVVANNLPQNTYLDVADAVIEHFGVEE